MNIGSFQRGATVDDSWEERSIGIRVRELREERGLSVQHLADACSVTGPAISQIEHGVMQPSISLIYRMARAMHVHPREFFV